MDKNPVVLYKSLVIGVIVLFIGVGIQSAFADVPFESYNSELVEITIQFYEIDRTINHTVMLTQEQANELENLINDFGIRLNSTDNPVEVETIYKDAIVSFNELGLLPDDISIDYAQKLVTEREHNIRIVKVYNKMFNKKKGNINDYENLFCLIAGDTTNTLFAGPVPILIALHFLIILYRINTILDWLSSISKLGDWLSNIFKDLFNELYRLRLGFWFYLGAGINFFPLKFGAFMFYGALKFDDYYPYIPYFVPAEGWVNTIGLSGKKSWSGSFIGGVVGFTGIKIIRGLFDFFYLGAALKVKIGYY